MSNKEGESRTRKPETSVRTVINQLKARLGFMQQPRTAAADEKKLEALMAEIETDRRLPVVYQNKQAEERQTMDELTIVNLAIERKYGELRTAKLDEREEKLCIENIQKLEMRRLSLMTRLHGQDLKGYAAAQ